MTRLAVIGFPISLTLGLLLASSETIAGSLYRCVTNNEGTIYTDNPAQLEQCSPITASGAVTSLATVSSGSPPTGASPDPPPMTQALPDPTVVMPPAGMPPPPIDMPPPNTTPNSQPCPVGLNPLNPFSAPPCPTADAAPSATITMPAGPGTPP
jgi:hypothetical protein